jgi:hypothetical protein
VHVNDPATSEHHESVAESQQHSDDTVPSDAGAENEDVTALTVDMSSGNIQEQVKDDVDSNAHDRASEARATEPAAGDVFPEAVEQTSDNGADLGSVQQDVQEDAEEAVGAQDVPAVEHVSTSVVHDEPSTLAVEDNDSVFEEATPAVEIAVQPQEPVEPMIEPAEPESDIQASSFEQDATVMVDDEAPLGVDLPAREIEEVVSTSEAHAPGADVATAVDEEDSAAVDEVESSIHIETVAPDVQMDTQDGIVHKGEEADIHEEVAGANEQVVEPDDEIIEFNDDDNDEPNADGETTMMRDQESSDDHLKTDSRLEVEDPAEFTGVVIPETTNLPSETPMPGAEEPTMLDDDVVAKAGADEGPVTLGVIADDVQLETPAFEFDTGEDDDATISQGAIENVVILEPGSLLDDDAFKVPDSAGLRNDERDAYPSLLEEEEPIEAAPEMESYNTEQGTPPIAPVIEVDLATIDDGSIQSPPDVEPESFSATLDDSAVDPGTTSVLPLEPVDDVPETVDPVLPEALPEQSSIRNAQILESETAKADRVVAEIDESLIGPTVDVDPAVDVVGTGREDAETITRGETNESEELDATQEVEISVIDSNEVAPEVERHPGIPVPGTASFITEHETAPADLINEVSTTTEDRSQLNTGPIEVVYPDSDPTTIDRTPADGAEEITDVVGPVDSVEDSRAVEAAIPDHQREVIETEAQVSSDRTCLAPSSPAIESACKRA